MVARLTGDSTDIALVHRQSIDAGAELDPNLGKANLERTYWEARAGADALLVKVVTNTL
jgi:hypothetical protein